VRVEPGRGLVEAEQARPHRDRARHADELALALRQLARHRLGERPELEQVERLVRRGAVPGGAADELRGQRQPGRALGGDHQVLTHRQVVEQLCALPRPREPAARACVRRHPGEIPPVELGPARVPDEARDRVDERRLAGAVRPDQPDELSFLDGDVDRVHGADAAEPDGQAGRLQDGGHDPPAGVEAASSALRFARNCAVR
jgi:hypothetical protein